MKASGHWEVLEMRSLGGMPVAVAALVLALAACGGEDAQDAAGTVDPGQAAGQAAGAVRDAADNVLKVGVGERSASGQYGSVTVTKIGAESSEVTVELFDGPGGRQFSAIHSGTCDDIGAMRFELNELNRGRSSTRVATSLDELGSSALSVVTRRSADPGSPVTACGELDPARALDRDPSAAADDAESLAVEICARVPAADLRNVLGTSDDDLRRLAEELTRELEVEDRDAVIDACLEQLENGS
jgi:hypothetical protein